MGKLRGLDLFTGIGGITLALQEWVKPVAYCEIEPYCQSVLLQRMQEGHLPAAPIWDDVRTLSAEELPKVDIIYGGSPCQDISVAGTGKGLEGKRSGLIFEVFRLIDEAKPSFVFLENVPNVRTKGAERICKELSERGYDMRWCMLSGGDVGTRHKRERWFLLAYAKGKRTEELFKGIWKKSNASGKDVADASGVRRDERACEEVRSEGKAGKHEKLGNLCEEVSDAECKRLHEGHKRKEGSSSRCGRQLQSDWSVEPDVGRVVNGLPYRVDRIKALGNAVVPLQAREAFKLLIGI